MRSVPLATTGDGTLRDRLFDAVRVGAWTPVAYMHDCSCCITDMVSSYRGFKEHMEAQTQTNHRFMLASCRPSLHHVELTANARGRRMLGVRVCVCVEVRVCVCGRGRGGRFVFDDK